MKKVIPVALVIATFVFQGCLKDKHIDKRTYTANVPIYMSEEDLKQEIKVQDPQELCTPRKIYAFNNYLLINELHKGIHIIDNSNPANPVNVKFIQIPGNVDMAVKETFLYADNFTNLLVFDITNMNDPKLVGRTNDVFTYMLPRHNQDYPISRIDPSKGTVVGWEVKEITETCVNGDCGSNVEVNFETDLLAFDDRVIAQGGGTLASGKAESIKSVNVAGSMARFMIKDNNLLTISSSSSISIFNISTEESPKLVNEVTTNLWGIETLFSYEENMFIGAESGMYIYDVSNPENPEYVSIFQHATGCDPVVVYDDKAYVTIRAEGECGGWENQLTVIDVENIEDPTELTTIPMGDPHGLGIDPANNLLFVADGDAGLKVYSEIEPSRIEGSLTKTVSTNAYDVIPLNGQLILIGDNGLNQYDYSNVNDMQELSSISVKACE